MAGACFFTRPCLLLLLLVALINPSRSYITHEIQSIACSNLQRVHRRALAALRANDMPSAFWQYSSVLLDQQGNFLPNRTFMPCPLGLLGIAANNMGVALALQNRPEESMLCFQQAVKVDPLDDIALRNWAWSAHSHPRHASGSGPLYDTVFSIHWLRALLTVSKRGTELSYASLLSDLLTWAGIATFQQSRTPGALSHMRGLLRMGWRLDTEFRHSGDGSVRVRAFCRLDTNASTGSDSGSDSGSGSDGGSGSGSSGSGEQWSASEPSWTDNTWQRYAHGTACDRRPHHSGSSSSGSGSGSSSGSSSGSGSSGGCAALLCALTQDRGEEVSLFELSLNERLCSHPFAPSSLHPPNSVRDTYLSALKVSLTGFHDLRTRAMHPPSHLLRYLSPARPHWFLSLSLAKLQRLTTAAIDLSPYPGDTMSSVGMMNHLQAAVEHVVTHGVAGDLVEAGVWRGGLVMWMAAVLHTLQSTHSGSGSGSGSGSDSSVGGRRVWAVDSFQGVPPPRTAHSFSSDWTHQWQAHLYNVSQANVRNNFQRRGLLHDFVRFLPGFFNESLPDAPITSIALLRMDGDTFESTHDILTSLYPRLSPGAIVIVDDFHLNGAQQAVHRYRAAHGITAPLHPIPEDFVLACRQGVARHALPDPPAFGSMDCSCARHRPHSPAPAFAAPPSPPPPSATASAASAPTAASTASASVDASGGTAGAGPVGPGMSDVDSDLLSHFCACDPSAEMPTRRGTSVPFHAAPYKPVQGAYWIKPLEGE